MADVTKYELIPNTHTTNNIVSDSKPSNFNISLFKLNPTKKKSTPFIYGVVLLFVLLTLFLAFSSSSTSSWFTNYSYRSHFPNIFSNIFPNSTQVSSPRSPQDYTFPPPESKNLTQAHVPPDKDANFEHPFDLTDQNSTNLPQSNPNLGNNVAFAEKQGNQSTNVAKNSTLTPSEQKGNHTNATATTNAVVSGNHSSSEVSVSPQISPVSANNTSVNAEKQGKQGSEVSVSPPRISPVTENSTAGSSNSTKNGNGSGVKSSDFAASLSKNKGKGNSSGNDSEVVKKQGNVNDNVNDEVRDLVGCDLYDGGWIRDDSYPLYKPGSCSFIDEQFNCVHNGRPDHDYMKLKWKPNHCSLPRLNGGRMLELLRGKRLVFVGDSLNRNMWESLVCILKNSVKNKKNVYEAFGRHSFRTEASYSFVFKDYNCTVEFFVAPFLTQQWEIPEKDGTTRETLRIDLMVRDANQFKDADFIVFNTGHWWTHDKTSKGEDYYQEGSHIYKQLAVTEAFRRAITTWARWVDANINAQRTQVLFRGYSASHFSGGQWNSGGACDSETEPIRNDTYLTGYPWKMKVFESVLQGMKTPVSYLNVTRLTDYRKDGHPSVYRKQHLSGDEKKSPLRYQDCSHWCLPGVPDSWNELLFAELLRKQHIDQQQKNKT